MTSRSTIHRLLLASALTGPLLASAECLDLYPSGACLYGQVATGGYAPPGVDVSSAAHVNVRVGGDPEIMNRARRGVGGLHRAGPGGRPPGPVAPARLCRPC